MKFAKRVDLKWGEREREEGKKEGRKEGRKEVRKMGGGRKW